MAVIMVSISRTNFTRSDARASCQNRPRKPRNRVGHVAGRQHVGDVLAFQFLDIEADVLDAFRYKELKHLVRGIEADTRQHRYGVEWDTPLAQPPDARKCLVERAAARTGHPLQVVQAPRAVDTDADIDLPLGEEVAPRRRDQHPVGLDGMRDAHVRGPQSLDRRERLRDRSRSASPAVRRHARSR